MDNITVFAIIGLIINISVINAVIFIYTTMVRRKLYNENKKTLADKLHYLSSRFISLTMTFMNVALLISSESRIITDFWVLTITGLISLSITLILVILVLEKRLTCHILIIFYNFIPVFFYIVLIIWSFFIIYLTLQYL